MTTQQTAVATNERNIHQTAVVGDGAKVDPTAEIGPYVVIGPNVTIGAGTRIGSHAVIDGHTTIGDNCKIYAGATIGLEPQDLKYKDEPTGVIMGNNVTVREYVTIHRGTGDRNTYVGDDCFLMNYVHIAHDCKVGRGVIMANSTTLAGHVQVDDFAVLSGMIVLHQFVRVGRGCMVGGMTGSRVDLPPYTLCDGRPAAVRGVNVIGLRRQKINAETRASIKQAYKFIYRQGLNTSQALEKIETELKACPELKEICDFYRNSKRGVAVAFGEHQDAGSLEDMPVDEI